MTDLLQSLPPIVGAVFAGAALYVNVVAQPARLGLPDMALLQEWVPSYRRGTVMQGSLALLAGLVGFAAYAVDPHWLWLAGSVLIFANWPFTLTAIAPITKRLSTTPVERAGSAERTDIQRWGRLHAVRTGLGFASVACFLAAGM